MCAYILTAEPSLLQPPMGLHRKLLIDHFHLLSMFCPCELKWVSKGNIHLSFPSQNNYISFPQHWFTLQLKELDTTCVSEMLMILWMLAAFAESSYHF